MLINIVITTISGIMWYMIGYNHGKKRMTTNIYNLANEKDVITFSQKHITPEPKSPVQPDIE